uniref:Selenoprotein O n=1 Tax=Clastoptera arizonana TaxID=38151 RepID=A0A1B6D888_9HEMI
MNQILSLGLVFFMSDVCLYCTSQRVIFRSIMKSSKNRSCNLINDFKQWHFSPSKLLQLPVEENSVNYVRRMIPNVIFSNVKPTPVNSPKLVAYSKDVLTNILNLDISVINDPSFIDFISGNYILNSSTPIAHRYGGYQFGYWAMQLGDGRAILLGEYKNCADERWELQLKGSGKTPYSRDGDGRAVLRSSIREFLCSESMHYLGIPTSRAGVLVVSKDKAIRDPLYNGNIIMENIAVLLRLSPTWFRFGSFELLSYRKEIDLLKQLIDFVIKEHFPEIDNESEDKVVEMFSKVSRLTFDLVLAWQSVGFTHGVLNTDNMNILGLTIDYGPFGFMEDYDPLYVPNASDTEARYCYIEQVRVITYNLVQLSEALGPLLSTTQQSKINEILLSETKYVKKRHAEIFSLKLGLTDPNDDLVKLFVTMLEDTKADFTMSFRELSEVQLENLDKPCKATNWALSKLATHKDYANFLKLYRSFLGTLEISDEERRRNMCSLNPRYILRNWMAQKAIESAEKDNFIEVERLLRVLSKPFEKQEEAEKLGFAGPSPEWAKKLKLSCSS